MLVFPIVSLKTLSSLSVVRFSRLTARSMLSMHFAFLLGLRRRHFVTEVGRVGQLENCAGVTNKRSRHEMISQVQLATCLL